MARRSTAAINFGLLSRCTQLERSPFWSNTNKDRQRICSYIVAWVGSAPSLIDFCNMANQLWPISQLWLYQAQRLASYSERAFETDQQYRLVYGVQSGGKIDADKKVRSTSMNIIVYDVQERRLRWMKLLAWRLKMAEGWCDVWYRPCKFRCSNSLLLVFMLDINR